MPTIPAAPTVVELDAVHTYDPGPALYLVRVSDASHGTVVAIIATTRGDATREGHKYAAPAVTVNDPRTAAAVARALAASWHAAIYAAHRTGAGALVTAPPRLMLPDVDDWWTEALAAAAGAV